MQPVNAMDIPFGTQISVDREVRIVSDALLRKIAGTWHRIREPHFTGSVTQRPSAAPDAISLPGYYGRAYHRLSASMPIVSCFEIIGTAPYPQGSTSRRNTCVAEKAERAARPGMEDDIWLDILRADSAIPARMT